MSRPLRINRVNAWYHVTARGNAGETIYRDDADRKHFLGLFGKLPQRYGAQVHGYVLMNNHYHLLLRTAIANLNQVMQWLNASYSIWFNKRHQRRGHLLGGRYGSVLIEGGEWLLATSMYIHLNPIRTRREGLSKMERKQGRDGRLPPSSPKEIRLRLERLRGYAWSSYPAYSGYVKAPSWLSRSDVLARVRKNPKHEKSETCYREYVEGQIREGQEESLRHELRNRAILGSKAFKRAIMKIVHGNKIEQPEIKKLRSLVDIADIIRAVEAVKGEKFEQFRDRHGDRGRDMVLWLARQRSGLTLNKLGKATGGLDYRTASSAIRRISRDLTRDSKLRRLANQTMCQIQKNEI